MPESSRRDSDPQPDDYRSPALPFAPQEHIVLLKDEELPTRFGLVSTPYRGAMFSCYHHGSISIGDRNRTCITGLGIRSLVL